MLNHAQSESEKSAEYYSVVRQDVLSWIDPAGKRVLDVGCGSGATGLALKERGAAEVIGIEIVPEAAQQATKVLDQVLIGDAAQVPLDYPSGYFDIVLCLDVLEHLAYPEEALKRMVPLLSDKGQVIVSLPNIRYIGTLKKLIIEGDWPREPSGVFDSTHLRWFTARSARRLFEHSGLRVTAWRRSPAKPFIGLVRHLPMLSRFLTDWFTTQFLFDLRKNSESPS
jgi:2-polyprenyl-3-methyl-5-hydroxy-6-metoxy-1,4-benzoquinol methylase